MMISKSATLRLKGLSIIKTKSEQLSLNLSNHNKNVSFNKKKSYSSLILLTNLINKKKSDHFNYKKKEAKQ